MARKPSLTGVVPLPNGQTPWFINGGDPNYLYTKWECLAIYFHNSVGKYTHLPMDSMILWVMMTGGWEPMNHMNRWWLLQDGGPTNLQMG